MDIGYALSNRVDGWTPSWRMVTPDAPLAEGEIYVPAHDFPLEGAAAASLVWDERQGRVIPLAEWQALREEEGASL